jgi:hypothetical protein
LYARLCIVAEQTGETVPELIVRLLTEWFEREGEIVEDGAAAIESPSALPSE